MLITIGKNTEKLMSLLGIKGYPFSSKELEFNYKRLLKRHHPDVNNNSAESNRKTKDIIHAYNDLKHLAVDVGMNDYMEAEKKLQKSKEDMFDLWGVCKQCKGSKVMLVKITNFSTCPNCLGKGTVILACRDCHGTGEFKQARSGRIVTCRRCGGDGVFNIVRCNMCGGEGEIPNSYKWAERPCYWCKGLGKVKVNPFNPVIKRAAVMV